MRVAIVGAGIGGLTAALACHATGLDVRLFEQAPALDEVGAGLQLGANATRVLERLDVLDALLAVGVRPREVRLRAAVSGRQVAVRPLGATNDARYGAPYLHLHRADLQRVLADAVRARGIPLQLDRRLQAVQQDDAGVHLELLDAAGNRHVATADACVGADGLHSRMGELLFGAAAPQFTGNVAWRATLPVAAIAALPAAAREPVVTVWMGDGGHLVQYLLRGGNLVNIVAVFEDARWTREGWHEPGDADALRARFAGWHPEVRALLAQVADCHLWALCDRPPMPTWHRGGCALLGDACHPMLPFLAQGAAMAIEDAWVLAGCLAAERHDPAAALARYTVLRQPRTARVQAEARQQATLFHLAGPAALARNLVLGFGSRVLPGVAMARYDWLYGHDVTQATGAVSPHGPRQ
jgi:salicylate hydroxylase